MKAWWLIFGGGLLVLILAGCGTDEVRIPKREPTHKTLWLNRIVQLTISTPTNCVEVGELVTITLMLKSTSDKPVVFSGTPPLDLEIISPSESSSSLPRQYWSKSTSYPFTTSLVLAPHEERMYQWAWPSTPSYYDGTAQPGVYIYPRRTLINDRRDSIPEQLGADSVYVGVGAFMSPMNVGVPCTKMPQ